MSIEVATTRDVELPQPGAPTRAVATSATSPSSRAPALGRLSRPLKILFVSASPGDKDQLVVDEEYRAIEQRIQRARHRDAFRLISLPAARRSDLQDALLEHAPHVVHFACHGSSQAEMYLLGDGPGSAPISAGSLASMFEVLHDDLVLVIFNACFASTQAVAVRPFARATIGMRSRVTDRASISFASALYGALAYGRSVQEAFNLGVAALDAPESGIPEIFERAAGEARSLRLVARRRRRAALLVVSALLAIAATAALTAARVAGPKPSVAPERPFVLDAQLSVHRSQGGRSITLEELRSGDVVMDGDRLQLSARTSTEGYLYLAFCSQRSQGAGLPGLSVFPPQNEIRLKANQTTPVPARLVVDNHPGPETLYVIVSRRELSRSDARLAAALAAARQERSTAECGAQFRGAVEGSRGGTASNARGGDVTSGAQRGGRSEGTNAAAAGHNRPSVTRGIDAEWADAQAGVGADPDGIVVLRYEFTHVPRPQLPAAGSL